MVCGAVMASVLWGSGSVDAYHMSPDLSKPPFLHRSNDASLLQWDTGDIACMLALSQAVVVNYQG
eukprot:397463-Rhodomonas_salina.1